VRVNLLQSTNWRGFFGVAGADSRRAKRCASVGQWRDHGARRAVALVTACCIAKR
jgi:hypothetical protein